MVAVFQLNVKKKLIDICNSFNQLITKPTRKDSILDLLFINNPQLEYIDVLPGIGDHDGMVKVLVNTGCSTTKFFLYKKGKFEDLRKDLKVLVKNFFKKCRIDLWMKTGSA